MTANFTIHMATTLVVGDREFDLHNDFDFKNLEYSPTSRRLTLAWTRSSGDWVGESVPTSVTITFHDVSEFRFLPRDPDMPLTEDSCLTTIGYWMDNEGGSGVYFLDPDQKPEPHWSTALEFASGAIIVVRASTAVATSAETL